jgi:hypothetical protein
MPIDSAEGRAPDGFDIRYSAFRGLLVFQPESVLCGSERWVRCRRKLDDVPLSHVHGRKQPK